MAYSTSARLCLIHAAIRKRRQTHRAKTQSGNRCIQFSRPLFALLSSNQAAPAASYLYLHDTKKSSRVKPSFPRFPSPQKPAPPHEAPFQESRGTLSSGWFPKDIVLGGCRGSAPPLSPQQAAQATLFGLRLRSVPREAPFQSPRTLFLWMVPKDSVLWGRPGSAPPPFPKTSRHRPPFRPALRPAARRSALSGVRGTVFLWQVSKGQRPLAGSGAAPRLPAQCKRVHLPAEQR
jgi:hypothetical protein